MSFSKIFETFDRVVTERQPVFDVGSHFLKTGVTLDFISISGKVPLLIQLLNIS